MPKECHGKAFAGVGKLAARSEMRDNHAALASAEDRLPDSRRFEECEVILGVVREGSVHKARYGHKCE